MTVQGTMVRSEVCDADDDAHSSNHTLERTIVPRTVIFPPIQPHALHHGISSKSGEVGGKYPCYLAIGTFPFIPGQHILPPLTIYASPFHYQLHTIH